MAIDADGGNGSMSAPIRGGVKVFIGGRVFTVGSEAEAAELTEMMTGKPVMRRGSGGNGLATAAGAAVTVAALFNALSMDSESADIRRLQDEKYRKAADFATQLKAVKPELAIAYADVEDKQEEIDRKFRETFAYAIDFSFLVAGAGGVMLAVGAQKYTWDDFAANAGNLNLAEVAIVGGFSAWVVNTYMNDRDRRDRDYWRDRDGRRSGRRSLRDAVEKLG